MEPISCSDTESEIEYILNNKTRLLRSGSVRMKALMFEINLPIQTPQMNCGEDKGSGYNFGQKWTYLGSGNKILFYKVFYFKGNMYSGTFSIFCTYLLG